MNSNTNSYNDTKYLQGKAYFEALYESGQLPVCSRGFQTGRCSTVHKFAFNVICGKEYCSGCGREGSPQHQKRFNRWLPKVKSFESCGFFVFTLPKELWQTYLNKLRLSAFRTALKNKLKRIGFDRGLMRWHLFGDCQQCEGKGCNHCNYTGAGTEFKPHLNVIVEWGYMENITTNEIMLSLQNFVKDYLKKKHNFTIDKPVINYSYADKKNQSTIVHQCKYITRSTFRIYDQSIAEILNKYRLTTTWGTFIPVYEEHNADEKLSNNICPHCNTPIIWIGFESQMKFTKLINLKNGRYEIPPPDQLHRTDQNDQTVKKQIRPIIKGDTRPQYQQQIDITQRRTTSIQRLKTFQFQEN